MLSKFPPHHSRRSRLLRLLKWIPVPTKYDLEGSQEMNEWLGIKEIASVKLIRKLCRILWSHTIFWLILYSFMITTYLVRTVMLENSAVCLILLSKFESLISHNYDKSYHKSKRYGALSSSLPAEQDRPKKYSNMLPKKKSNFSKNCAPTAKRSSASGRQSSFGW